MRSFWFLLCFALAVTAFAVAAPFHSLVARGEDAGGAALAGGDANGDVAGLQDMLEKGLRARLPQDFIFIGKVVAMVRNNQLPRELVIGTFHWVRENRGNYNYKMPYFERVLRLRAAQIGVTII